MIIETPIHFVTIQGNLKQQVSVLPFVIVATYEEHTDKTYVVIDAPEGDQSKIVEQHFYGLYEDLSKHKKRFNEDQVTVIYSKEGIDFKISN